MNISAMMRRLENARLYARFSGVWGLPRGFLRGVAERLELQFAALLYFERAFVLDVFFRETEVEADLVEEPLPRGPFLLYLLPGPFQASAHVCYRRQGVAPDCACAGTAALAVSRLA